MKKWGVTSELISAPASLLKLRPTTGISDEEPTVSELIPTVAEQYPAISCAVYTD